MRTLSRQSSTKETAQEKSFRGKVLGGRSHSISPLSTGEPLLQRQCACGGGCPRCKDELGIQTKLKISEPGDMYEQEADRVADEVMRMPATESHRTELKEGNGEIAWSNEISSQITPFIQRQSVPEIEEDVEKTLLDNSGEEEDIEPDETGMPKRENGAASLNSEYTSNIHIPRGSGHPLTKDGRDFMEQRFGLDFSRVRVHTNAEAEKSSQELQARAYTIGENIYFNRDQYAPSSIEGRKLLAHELTHVVQQSAWSDQNLQRKSSKGSGSVCSAGNCPQGKQKKVTRDECKNSDPVNKDRFITDLHVSLSAQELEVVWSDGTTENWDCSPNSSVTPTGADVVGTKCSVNHTNKKKDGMAWFTGFKSEGLRIGFHDSQPVGKGFQSHGCVRVCCDKAKIINENTWSEKTKIFVAKK
jgi:Domain of unknown function (DUF4157)